MTHLSNTIRLTLALLASTFLPLIYSTSILPLLLATHICVSFALFTPPPSIPSNCQSHLARASFKMLSSLQSAFLLLCSDSHHHVPAVPPRSARGHSELSCSWEIIPRHEEVHPTISYLWQARRKTGSSLRSLMHPGWNHPTTRQQQQWIETTKTSLKEMFSKNPHSNKMKTDWMFFPVCSLARYWRQHSSQPVWAEQPHTAK